MPQERSETRRTGGPSRRRDAYIHVAPPTRERAILSEFYHLRRTAIKDLAAYVGFLAGFIGSAPFAWGLLASQLESGTFVRGLWYFFGIVTAAGIFSGIAGLGIGFTVGLVWEQFHRYRRRERLNKKAILEASNIPADEMASPQPIQSDDPPPRLQLVGASPAPLPNLTGRRLRSVTFRDNAIELDFGALQVEIGTTATVTCGTETSRYPGAGSRDAICALIGARVDRIRSIIGDCVEISYDNGCDITVLRSGLAVA